MHLNLRGKETSRRKLRGPAGGVNGRRTDDPPTSSGPSRKRPRPPLVQGAGRGTALGRGRDGHAAKQAGQRRRRSIKTGQMKSNAADGRFHRPTYIGSQYVNFTASTFSPSAVSESYRFVGRTKRPSSSDADRFCCH